MLWRYPNPFLAQPPPSPLETQVKSGLPGENNFSKDFIQNDNIEIENMKCPFQYNGAFLMDQHIPTTSDKR